MEQNRYPKVCVVMRSYNDAAVIRQTLQSVMAQDYPHFELWNFDSSSNDGTLDYIRAVNAPDRICLNDSKTYNPGRVLNDAMRRTDSEIVVFINSDATPERTDWLRKMVEPFLADAEVAAVFGRQTSRPDCRTLFHKDNERAFGDGTISATWRHFFSMANSAVRRSVYEQFPFETQIQYSEDIEWSYRLKKAGHKIQYVAQAPATHSHNYTLKQSFKRHYGEGKADAWIYRAEAGSEGLFRHLVSAVIEILRDLRWSVKARSLDGVLHAVPLRLTQRIGRWKGYKAGQRQYG